MTFALGIFPASAGRLVQRITGEHIPGPSGVPLCYLMVVSPSGLHMAQRRSKPRGSIPIPGYRREILSPGEAPVDLDKFDTHILSLQTSELVG